MDEPAAALPPLEEAVEEAVVQAPGQVTVVGHSLGAWLAAATEARMPARVDRFVAISGLCQLTEEGVAARRELLTALEGGQLEPDELARAVLEMFRGPRPDTTLDARLAPMVALDREHWARLIQRALGMNDRPPVSFERPATVVHGTNDAAVPLASGEELARRSSAELVRIETSSHMLPMTHAETLAPIVYQ